MAKSILPILALGAGALFLMKKKKGGDGTAEEALPKNVNLVDVADFQWGSKVLVGTDMTADERDQIVDMVSAHAKAHPSLTFVVTRSDGSPFTVVTVMANGVPYSEVVNSLAGAGAVLTKLLNERIPKPGNGDGTPDEDGEFYDEILRGSDNGVDYLEVNYPSAKIGETIRLEFGEGMVGIGYTAPGSVELDMTRKLGDGYVDVQLLRAGAYKVKVNFNERAPLTFSLYTADS